MPEQAVQPPINHAIGSVIDFTIHAVINMVALAVNLTLHFFIHVVTHNIGLLPVTLNHQRTGKVQLAMHNHTVTVCVSLGEYRGELALLGFGTGYGKVSIRIQLAGIDLGTGC